jgi:hypothetical protein
MEEISPNVGVPLTRLLFREMVVLWNEKAASGRPFSQESRLSCEFRRNPATDSI